MQLIAKLVSPLKVTLPRKIKNDRSWILNLNNYRNTHFQILNQAKHLYKDFMQEQIVILPSLQRIAVRFILFPRTQRMVDTSNVCSIHDKFFMDALVEAHKLPDDNYRHYVETGYKFGGIDKGNPRVDIEIYAVT